MTEANRWLLYAALFGVLVLLLRDDRLGTVVVGAGAATILALGGYIIDHGCSPGTGDELFLGGRLNEPLGYVNGQSGYLLLGSLAPDRARGARAKQPLVAGAGLAGATFLGGLVLLGQTRAVVPAVVVSALLLLVAVPGRTRRAWALAVAGAGIAACIGPVLDVYDSVGGRRVRRPTRISGRRRSPSCLPRLAAGAVWAGAVAVVGRLGTRAAAARRFAWAPLVLRRRRSSRRSRSPRSTTRSSGCATSTGRSSSWSPEPTPLPASRPAAATATTTGASPGTSSRTSRCAASAPATTTAPTSSSAGPSRTSASRTASSCRRWGSSGSSAALLLAVFLVAILAGFARRARAARDDPQVAAAGGGGRGHVRGLARPYECRLAASDPGADRDRALRSRRAGRTLGPPACVEGQGRSEPSSSWLRRARSGGRGAPGSGGTWPSATSTRAETFWGRIRRRRSSGRTSRFS